MSISRSSVSFTADKFPEKPTILFLDFDGVLHPDEVYLTPKGPQLRSAGQLFMWAPILEAELDLHPSVKLVLSTSWVRVLGFSQAKKRLPQSLQARVIGSTWHSSMAKVWADQVWWDKTSRHNQIMRYASRARINNWLALDDDAGGWSVDDQEKLILVDSATGISIPEAAAALRFKLDRLVSHQ